MIDIYNYLDYRKYLEDYYQYMKRKSPKFSYRWFASVAGYSSSGYYSNVVKGIHNISDAYLEKFIIAMKLDPPQAEYFRLLVKYDHCKSSLEKNKLLDELTGIKPSEFFRLQQSHYLYYSHWYTPVIHQALSIFAYTNEAKELAELITPRVSKEDVIKTIDLLKSLHLIAPDEDGYLRPINPTSIGGSEVGIRAIREFQKDLMGKAQESLDTVEPDKRHIVSTTLTVNSKGIQEIKGLVQEFQNKIIAYTNNNES